MQNACVKDVLKTTIPAATEIAALAEQFDVIPLVRSLPCPSLDPVLLYQSIRNGKEGFIFESGKGGQYTFVGTGGSRRIESRDGQHNFINGSKLSNSTEDLFAFLRTAFAAESCYCHPERSEFQGGAVGYFSYDVARWIERLPESSLDDLHFPDALFIFPESFFRVNHRNSTVDLVCLIRPGCDGSTPDQAYANGVAQLDAMELVVDTVANIAESDVLPVESKNTKDVSADAEIQEGVVRTNISREEFCRAVEQAIEYILAGDIFQANLSIRFARDYAGDPLELYRTLRRINPAPYMTFLEFSDHAVVGASPELLLKVNGQELSTRPIAGTRKRGADEAEDEAKARELIENEKERAEHVMLVDMERNDIGRVAKYGTVHVDEFMAIEKYSHVMHIVSNVRGQLSEQHDLFDAIKATFPGGTITGAPKVRAMEIIEELEPTRRGIYTGSVGWIGYNGNAELNISIRTMVVKDGVAYAQAGAGIVADSVPEYEHKESLRKAEAALKALRETVNSL